MTLYCNQSAPMRVPPKKARERMHQIRLDLAARNMTHGVQCDSGHGWETIALFNVEAVALAYGRECAGSHDPAQFQYRVVKLT